MSQRCEHGFLPPLCERCHAGYVAPPRHAALHGAGPRQIDETKRRGDPRRFSHPCFVDMTGKDIAGVAVLQRARNQNGNACWVVLAACGHRWVAQGIALRAAEKQGRKARCPECRPVAPGVRRTW